MTISQSMIDRTRKFEGSVAYMYLDTAGKVTVGTGHMLSSSSGAAKLKFTLINGGQTATSAQIKAEHALLLQQIVGKPASYYKKFRTMEMSTSDMDVLLKDDLGVSESDLESIFSNYRTFPVSAQEALIDMAFNLGKTKFLDFVDLIDSCSKSDWARSATECHRNGVSNQRNKEIKDLFESLHQAEMVASRKLLLSVPERPARDTTVGDSSKRQVEPERRAAELLKETISCLAGEASAGGSAPPRLFFPDGIQLIDIRVTVGLATVSIRVSGSQDVKTESKSPSATAVPNRLQGESCREVFRLGLASDLKVGEMVPNKSEAAASGAITKKIKRADPEFKLFISNTNPEIVFKDEEGTGADRMMTTRLGDALAKLATATSNEWIGVKLRVTEAWDEGNEHAGQSLHYEGRAADLTTDPIDSSKLGRLGRLAVDAGFDWVLYENSTHVHVSVTA